MRLYSFCTSSLYRPSLRSFQASHRLGIVPSTSFLLPIRSPSFEYLSGSPSAIEHNRIHVWILPVHGLRVGAGAKK